MTFVVFGSALFLVGAMLVIVGEARAKRERQAPTKGAVPPLGEGEIDPRGSVNSIAVLAKYSDAEEDESTMATAVTLYEPDADKGIDEPTGQVELIAVHAAGRTDPGQVRARNEDNCLVMSEHALYVVADGMGGHGAGHIASETATRAMREMFENGSFPKEQVPGRPRRGNELVWAMQAANTAVFERSHSDHECTGMGTTLVAARFSPKKQRVYIGHVGDSRCYRYRDGELRQITEDHTLAKLGVTGPQAGNLSRALGIHKKVTVDLIVDAPFPGDTYLLCSDGLPKMLSDKDIGAVLTDVEDAEARVEKLIHMANERGGRDNVTVVLINVLAPTAKSVSHLLA